MSTIGDAWNAVQTLTSEPLFEGLWKALQEPWVPVRPVEVKDESLGAFISRRFGSALADNLASAVGHGIFAGDIYQLSARTVMPLLWHLETRDRDLGRGILVDALAGRLNQRALQRLNDREHRHRWLQIPSSQVPRKFRVSNSAVWNDFGVFTLKRGLGQLTSALAEHLRQDGNVHIKENTPVQSVHFSRSRNRLEVRSDPKILPDKEPSRYDYVVSTLDPRHMGQILSNHVHDRDKVDLEEKTRTALNRSSAAVNVMVVNLYYQNPALIPMRGFGYLLPRSVPIDQNPERALGVLFSSETSGTFDPVDRHKLPSFALEGTLEPDETISFHENRSAVREGPQFVSQDTAPGTKLTVMMGGHWWTDWAESDLPSEAEAIKMVQNLLERHLNIQEKPVVAKARLNRQCIPQYRVGYLHDMATISDEVMTAFDGRLKAIGPWWNGAPGINDCVRAAQDIAWAIRDGKNDVTGIRTHRNDLWVVRHIPTRSHALESTE
jgi:protoporphyrinogen/coproporphyrinogen III oxidase